MPAPVLETSAPDPSPTAPAASWATLPPPWRHPLVPALSLGLVLSLAVALPMSHEALVGSAALRAIAVADALRELPGATTSPGLRDAATDLATMRLQAQVALDTLRALVACLLVGGVAALGLLARAVRLPVRAAAGVAGLSVGAALGAWALVYAATVATGGLGDAAATWHGTTPVGLPLLGRAWAVLPFAGAVGLPWAVQASVTERLLGHLAPEVPRPWRWGTALAPLLIAMLGVAILRQVGA